MVILTIRAADGTPIRIPLTKLQIRSVEIDGTPVWEQPKQEPEEVKPE